MNLVFSRRGRFPKERGARSDMRVVWGKTSIRPTRLTRVRELDRIDGGQGTSPVGLVMLALLVLVVSVGVAIAVISGCGESGSGKRQRGGQEGRDEHYRWSRRDGMAEFAFKIRSSRSYRWTKL